METRVEQILEHISGVPVCLMNKERTSQQTSGIQASLTTEKQTLQLDEVMVLSSCLRHALWPDWAMTYLSCSHFCPCTCGTECLKAHRSPLKHSLPLAIHQHGVSLLLLSLTRRCFAALAAEVRLIGSGALDEKRGTTFVQGATESCMRSGLPQDRSCVVEDGISLGRRVHGSRRVKTRPSISKTKIPTVQKMEVWRLVLVACAPVTHRLADEYVARSRRWIPESNSQQRLDSSDASPDVKPRVGAKTIRSVAAHSPTVPTPSIPAAARSVIQPGVVADVPSPRRERQVHWGPVELGYANELDRCVKARSDARTDVCNHESSRCV